MSWQKSKIQKNPTELRLLTRAAKEARDILNIVSRRVKPGIRENEIAHDIEKLIKKRKLRHSFRTIVASGKNGAKPHAKVTDRKIGTNDLVVIDLGVVYKGYRSDITRTLMVGKINAKMKKLYKTVKTAQAMAIKKISPGIKISDFVKGIHDYMRKKGFGKYILHGLGHGIGIKVHEPPKLSEKNRNVLKENIVLTIEPGLYIKGEGGVRIEDMIYLTKNEKKVLTR